MRNFAYLTVLMCAVFLAAEDSITGQETIADGLTNPCGITFQPETGILFLSDSGAGRILRIVDGKTEEVITGFPKDVYGKGPKYDIGPLGLGFINKDTLVVGDGSNVDGEELLRVFKIPASGKPAIKADDTLSSHSLPATEDIKGEGNFYGIAISGNNVYVTCNGDDTKGWVSKAVLEGNKTKSYERFIATKEATEVDAPVGIAIEPSAGHIAIGQMGEISIPEDSLLTFYSTDGRMLANYETGLSDIAGLAYSPGNQLYAVDFSWYDTKNGGLFHLIKKLENGKSAVEAIKIASLDKPTAMTFDSKGSLYVTVIGTAKDGADKPAGKVLKFTPDQLRKK